MRRSLEPKGRSYASLSIVALCILIAPALVWLTRREGSDAQRKEPVRQEPKGDGLRIPVLHLAKDSPETTIEFKNEFAFTTDGEKVQPIILRIGEATRTGFMLVKRGPFPKDPITRTRPSFELTDKLDNPDLTRFTGTNSKGEPVSIHYLTWHTAEGPVYEVLIKLDKP